MKYFRKKFEAIFTAVTFAEAGDHDSALRFLRDSEIQEEPTERVKELKAATKSSKGKTIREQLSSHFMAAAFSEAGEYETARQMVSSYERKKTVLLAIEGEFPNETTFDYTVNLCRRLNADMDILQVVSRGRSEEDSPSEGLSDLLPRLEREGISFNLTVRKARVDEIIYDHVRIHRDVVTAVIDSPTLRDKEAAETYWRETFQNIAQKLAVPLVTALQREPEEVPARFHQNV
jgi:hypothetical protein